MRPRWGRLRSYHPRSARENSKMALARWVVYAGKGSIPKGETMNTPRIIVSVLIAVGASATPLFGTLIADSVAEFSGVQGQDNWYYGYWDRSHDGDGIYQPGEILLMPQFLTNSSINYGNTYVPAWYAQDGIYWTALHREGGHPNGLDGNSGRLREEHWTIRRWESETSGLIDLTGTLSKQTTLAGNGIIGRIFVDGVELISQYIDAADFTGVNYNIQALVSVGSIVDFVIDPSQSSDISDHVRFTARISPEPNSGVFLLLGLTGLVLWRRGANVTP